MKVDNFQQQLTDDISKIFSQPGAVRLGYSGISDVGKFIQQTVAEAAKSANVAVLGMNEKTVLSNAPPMERTTWSTSAAPIALRSR